MSQRFIFTCLLLMAVCGQLHAQCGWPDMRVIFRQYNQHKQDTIGVQTLLRLSEIYKNVSNTKSMRDSSLLMASQAAALSKRLNYGRGIQQALYQEVQYYRQTKDLDPIRALLLQVHDTTQIKIMLDVSADQIQRSPEDKNAMDTSIYYIRHAIRLSDAIHYLPGKVNSLLQMATHYQYTNEQHKGYPFFVQAFSISQKAGYIAGEALCYARICTYLLNDSGFYNLKEHIWEQMMVQYKKLTDQRAIFEAQINIAYASNQADMILGGNNDGPHAAQEQMRGIEFAKTCIMPDMGPYWSVICGYIQKGDLNKALFYALEAVRVTEKNGNKQLDERAYVLLGVVYSHIGKYEAEIADLHKAIAVLKQKDHVPSIMLLRFLAKANEHLHLQGNSIPYLLEYAEHTPIHEEYEKVHIYSVLAASYLDIGQTNMAEKYALLELEIAKGFLASGVRLDAYGILTSIYLSTKQYDKARYYGLEILKYPEQMTMSSRRQAYAYMFSIDTATHHDADAVQDLLAYNRLTDSTFNITKNKQLEELKVQYETEKKEKDIQLLTRQNELQHFTFQQQKLLGEFEQEKKQRAIEQMAFQSERKDKDLSYKEANISLLLKQRQLQDTALVQSQLIRNGLLIGAILLALLLGMTYNRYRIKQKNNRLLEVQQQKINQSNIALQQLNGKQQQLLTEKEWLIKEVHHRVKNNLQLVISLLNMQSHYLKDEFTLNAFSAIGRRIQAISLIHQKLYQVTDLTKINMQDYVRELLSYLSQGNAGKSSVQYDLQVDPISMDPSMSVPLGLIINEAVIQAIKYAGTPGKICVRLKKDEQNKVSLLVNNESNCGFVTGNKRAVDPMTFKLIETLSKQLNGALTLSEENGYRMELEFGLTDALISDDPVMMPLPAIFS